MRVCGKPVCRPGAHLVFPRVKAKLALLKSPTPTPPAVGELTCWGPSCPRTSIHRYDRHLCRRHRASARNNTAKFKTKHKRKHNKAKKLPLRRSPRRPPRPPPPVCRLPMCRLPLYRLPVCRLPVCRLKLSPLGRPVAPSTRARSADYQVPCRRAAGGEITRQRL